MLLAVLMLLVTREARAANTARLIYLRGHGTEACPDEQALKDAVAARLGYDPFTPWALDTLFAELERDGAAFVARIKLVTPDSVVRGERTLRASSGCEDLVPTLALTISLAIDPMAGTRKGPPEGLPPAEREITSVPSEPGPAAPAVSADEPAAPSTPRAPLRFAVGLGTMASLGVAPAPSIGALLFGRVRYRDFSLALEGRADLPASAEGHTGTVSSFLVGGSLVPCGHTGAFFACARGSVGALSARGLDISSPRSSQVPWAEIGGRIGYELPLGDVLALRLHVDGGLVLLRYALSVGRETVFEHPPLHGGLGIGLAARIP
ncbi:MAG TPA: hypothetical protein VLT33_42910 [Labilithrix sp.]|nr:hypothetical protein [Labilithrix sp.]